MYMYCVVFFFYILNLIIDNVGKGDVMMEVFLKYYIIRNKFKKKLIN